jgi:methylenetetrahydrofolate/methylenetetrahydromethanopterin dehydrogenase (NADP+)
MRKILLQLDTDPQPSVFDRVVAVDAGAEEIFSCGGVKPEQVQALVHGAIFTRAAGDLKNTAIFIGGSDVTAAEGLFREAQKHMLPQYGLRVSILIDANGANTTAAAAVRAAAKNMDLNGAPALVLGGTGPVGQRVARLLARAGAEVRVASRQESRAAGVCREIAIKVPNANLSAIGVGTAQELNAALQGRTLVIAAGAAGVVLLPKSARLGCASLKIAIDLNAVPPLGIEGIEVTDKAKQRDGVLCFGAIGVGGTKMKAHKAALAKLFESNDKLMDAEEVYQIAMSLG